jgi:hypothetical protein
MNNEERNTAAELGLEPEPAKGEITPEQRIALGLLENEEKIKKECVPLIDRCTTLAQRAWRRKAETAAFDFTAKMKTADSVHGLRAEYEELKKEIYARLNNLARHDADNYEKVLSTHLRMLDGYFGVDDDFGHRPLNFVKP